MVAEEFEQDQLAHLPQSNLQINLLKRDERSPGDSRTDGRAKGKFDKRRREGKRSCQGRAGEKRAKRENDGERGVRRWAFPLRELNRVHKVWRLSLACVVSHNPASDEIRWCNVTATESKKRLNSTLRYNVYLGFSIFRNVQGSSDERKWFEEINITQWRNSQRQWWTTWYFRKGIFLGDISYLYYSYDTYYPSVRYRYIFTLFQTGYIRKYTEILHFIFGMSNFYYRSNILPNVM